MNYGNIKECDIADGPGVRVTLFVSGCRHHCKGCFNSETWNFQYGVPFTEETQDKILKLLEPGYIQGFTLLGGEPFEPENQAVLVHLLKKIRETYPQKTSGVTADICLIRICSQAALFTRNIQKKCCVRSMCW